MEENARGKEPGEIEQTAGTRAGQRALAPVGPHLASEDRRRSDLSRLADALYELWGRRAGSGASRAAGHIAAIVRCFPGTRRAGQRSRRRLTVHNRRRIQSLRIQHPGAQHCSTRIAGPTVRPWRAFFVSFRFDSGRTCDIGRTWDTGRTRDIGRTCRPVRPGCHLAGT